MLEIMGLNKDRITSLELLDQINIFRKQEGNRAELQHKDLLKIIRNEFEEEINEGKISLVEYKDKKGELRPMYILTYNQAKQVLLRESKFVRRAVIHYVERLEEELQKDFIEKFAEQFDDVDINALSAETKFREIDGYTSLVALLIITMIDEEYNVTVTGDDMKQQVTIGDLFNLVASRL